MTDVYDITHGPGGLWESWLWDGSLQINTDLDEDSEGIFLLGIDGMNGLPEHDDPRAKRVGRHGEIYYPTTFNGRTIVLTGELRAHTLPALRLLRTSFIAAFATIVIEGTMDMDPHPGVGGPTSRFYARATQLTVPQVPSDDTGHFVLTYTLALRQSDPRFYFPDLGVDEVGSANVAVTNPGTAPVDPVITLTGAADDVVVTDGTRTLTFRNVPSGTLIIDFGARTATVSGDSVELVEADSDWWDSYVDGVSGGATVTIAQTGASGIEVEFTPADW